MSDKPLGFEKQPQIEGSCGAYALGHALNLVGITGEIENFKNTSNYVSWSKSTEKNLNIGVIFNPISALLKISEGVGTLERGILSGIKRSGCYPIRIDNYSRSTSKQILDTQLKSAHPVIIFVNYSQNSGNSGHWIVCAGKDQGKYIIIDSLPLSNSNKDIISFYNWDELSERCTNYVTGEKNFHFFGFAVQSTSGISGVKRFNKYINKIIKDKHLRERWGYYLTDLLQIFEFSSHSADKISSNVFFANYSSGFIQKVKNWNDDFDISSIKKELMNYQIVAEIYDLMTSKSKIEDSLIAFTAALIKASRSR